MAPGRVDEIVRLAVEPVAGGVLLFAGVEKPEHALNDSSPNRMIIRAAHWKKIVRAGCPGFAELSSAEPDKNQNIYQTSMGFQQDPELKSLLRESIEGSTSTR